MTTAEPDAVRASTPDAKRAQALRESRRRDSRTKRDQVTAALSTMLAAGDQISYASVARRAGVSTWLAYAPGVREQVDTAITQQTSDDKRQAPNESSRALRTDLELARQEIRRLRGERDELRRHLQSTLGQQLTNLTSAPLIERIATLSQELTQTRQANSNLTDEVTALQDDLDASRRALRQMMKNIAVDATVS
jgi:chromosome segregation ATPase